MIEPAARPARRHQGLVARHAINQTVGGPRLCQSCAGLIIATRRRVDRTDAVWRSLVTTASSRAAGGAIAPACEAIWHSRQLSCRVSGASGAGITVPASTCTAAGACQWVWVTSCCALVATSARSRSAIRHALKRTDLRCCLSMPASIPHFSCNRSSSGGTSPCQSNSRCSEINLSRVEERKAAKAPPVASA